MQHTRAPCCYQVCATYDDIIAFMIWNNGEKHGCVALLRLDTLSARAARRAGVHGRQHNAEDY